jgi:hypothetical protein
MYTFAKIHFPKLVDLRFEKNAEQRGKDFLVMAVGKRGAGIHIFHQ